MEVRWFLSFDSPALAAWNVLCLGITILALAMLVRRLVRRGGLHWRDLLFLPSLVVNGTAVPIFIVAWLLAEWITTHPSESPTLDGDPWVPESRT